MPRTARTDRHAETRGVATRKATQRPHMKDPMERALNIPAHEIPAGVTYTWMRVSVRNEQDMTNWQQKIGKGWKPVPRERHVDRFPILDLPGISDPKYNSIIFLGGLILCERPTEDVEYDIEAQQNETQEQIEGVDWDNRRERDVEGAPKFSESSRPQIERTVASFKNDED